MHNKSTLKWKKNKYMYKAVKMTRLLIDTTNKAKLMFINFVN